MARARSVLAHRGRRVYYGGPMTPHKFLPSLTRKQDYCGYNSCGQQESHPIHQVPWPTPRTPEEAAIDKLAALFRWKAEPITEEHHAAIRRLLSIALRDTGQSRRVADFLLAWYNRSEEYTSELQSHSFISYAVFCLKKNK